MIIRYFETSTIDFPYRYSTPRFSVHRYIRLYTVPADCFPNSKIFFHINVKSVLPVIPARRKADPVRMDPHFLSSFRYGNRISGAVL